MNYNLRLEQLIEKNNIDELFPEYSKYIKAKDILNSFFVDQKDIFFFVTSKTDKMWFEREMAIDSNRIVVCEAGKTGDFNIYKDKVDNKKIWILSYNHRYELYNAMCSYDIEAEVRLLYDFLEMHGLFFGRDYYDFYCCEMFPYSRYQNNRSKDYYFFDLNRIFFFHRRQYEESKKSEEKEIYLKKMIFDCAIARDFLGLNYWIDEYCKLGFSEIKKYQGFKTEVDQLLSCLRTDLNNRKKKDVIMLWLDALEYGMDRECMPYLKELDKEAVVFDNIYTIMPYTSHTFKTLFCKSKPIEDEGYLIEKINAKNAGLIEYIEKNGWDFKYYGRLSCVSEELHGNHFYGYYDVFSKMVFDVLTDLVNSETKKFVLLHEIAQTHPPYVSFGVENDMYFGGDLNPGENYSDKQKKQKTDTYRYLDREISFWEMFLPENLTRIYMSDHGVTKMGSYHPIMKIVDKEQKPKRIKKLCSYYDFDKILKALLNAEDIENAVDDSDYVIIQNLDYYNKDAILDVIRDDKFDTMGYIGGQGVITKKETYYRAFDGEVMYQKHINDYVPVSDAELERLDKLTSTQRPAVYLDDKFKYTRIFLKALDRKNNRYNSTYENVKEFIFTIFRNIEEGSVVAIRVGGWETERLLLDLPEDLRKKVDYIIDLDEDCPAGKLGYKVISEEQIINAGINIVIVNSSLRHKMMVNRLKSINGGFRIIDLNEKLLKLGVPEGKEYYRPAFIAEDFEDSIYSLFYRDY